MKRLWDAQRSCEDELGEAYTKISRLEIVLHWYADGGNDGGDRAAIALEGEDA